MSFSMGMMKVVMMREHRSLHDFDTTVARIRAQAVEAGWQVPMEFPLQEHYVAEGLEDMTRAVNLYLCNPQGGYAVSRDDAFKPMYVLMPTPLSVYEDSTGQVRIARLRLGRLAMMFGGVVGKTLADGEERLRTSLDGVVED